MCDFKPGDEVVCVYSGPYRPDDWCGDPPVEGAIYTVRAVGISALSGLPGVWLREIRNDGDGVDDAYQACRFRKVQRRDLTAWLKTATKFEEPKRKKANA